VIALIYMPVDAHQSTQFIPHALAASIPAAMRPSQTALEVGWRGQRWCPSTLWHSKEADVNSRQPCTMASEMRLSLLPQKDVMGKSNLGLPAPTLQVDSHFAKLVTQ